MKSGDSGMIFEGAAILKKILFFVTVFILGVFIVIYSVKSVVNSYIGILSEVPDNIYNFQSYGSTLKSILKATQDGDDKEVKRLEIERLNFEIHYQEIAEGILQKAHKADLLQS